MKRCLLLLVAFVVLGGLGGCVAPRAAVMTCVLAGEVMPKGELKKFTVQPFLSRFMPDPEDDHATAEVALAQPLGEAMALYGNFFARQGWTLEGAWDNFQDGLPYTATRHSPLGGEELLLTGRRQDPQDPSSTILKLELRGDYLWAEPAKDFLNWLVGLEIAAPLYIIEFPLGWIL